jgi:hypothetical protein
MQVKAASKSKMHQGKKETEERVREIIHTIHPGMMLA